MLFKYKACVVGGCGHVGLPLAITFADAGLNTAIYDINKKMVESVSSGIVPFKEAGAQEKLKKALKSKKLKVSGNISLVKDSEYIIVIIGTPIDRYHNPEIQNIYRVIDELAPCLQNGQTIVLRSTLYPGTTRLVADILKKKKKKIRVAFCPERVAQGFAIEEIKNLPQIISGVDKPSLESARALFSKITKDLIALSTEEAELAKLFTNAWRYIQFATANQFFIISDQRNLDFHKILHAIKHKYPRAKDFPGSGFAAGPCLFKDTMQLSAFHQRQFFLGHSAMLVNEGLPDYIVTKLKNKHDLKKKKVSILGMAFKADNDDKRDSLSYKLMKLLKFEAGEVFCTDPYINDDGFVPLKQACQGDIIILGTPHKEYKYLRFKPTQKVVDIWNYWGKGGII